MDIIITKNKKQMTVTLNGKLDTMTAPALEEKLSDGLDGIEKLIFEFTELKYISSAGLRVLMLVVEIMEEQGSVVFRNVCKDVMDVFDVTGITDFLNFEQKR